LRITRYLAELEWTLEGWQPHAWRSGLYGVKLPYWPEVAVPARVPGSVQQSLRDANLLPDWNVGLNSRACERVEHRHWLFRTRLPADWFDALGRSNENSLTYQLVCDGLDGFGMVLFNGRQIGRFDNAFLPHRFTLPQTGLARETHELILAFTDLPAWRGTPGFTSQMPPDKPRFNYGWDWCPRLVQIGIYDDLRLECTQGPFLRQIGCWTDFDPDREAGTFTTCATVEDDCGVDNLPTSLSVAAELRDGRQVLASYAMPVTLAGRITASYIERRQHHPSLILWCGGNELQAAPGRCVGIGEPVTNQHPLIAAMRREVDRLDPDRRFVPASSSGPRFTAEACNFGKGLHHDVHGPWRFEDRKTWEDYWSNDDALFRSEVGCPGAAPASVIREYAADQSLPGSIDNPLWRHACAWWLQWDAFLADGGDAKELDAYVDWSQKRQADVLALAAEAARDRFPACGGFILWMGHDCFPCPVNTSILDVHGRPKPAARALAEVFGGASRSHRSRPGTAPGVGAAD